jgi:hypothetical protein
MVGAATYPAPAIAYIEVLPSIAELFSEADLVVFASIAKRVDRAVDGERCGHVYTVEVQHAFKDRLGNGVMAGQSFSFGGRVELIVNREYLLFLAYEESWERTYDRIVARRGEPEESVETLKRFIECDGLVPGYIHDYRTPWIEHQGSLYVRHFLPTDLPDRVRWYEENYWWSMNAADVFSYLRDLSELERDPSD